MNITIILNEPYPYGMACTNRIQLYAKGLNSAGAKSKIILPKPKITNKKLNVPAKGSFEGVDYQYAAGNAYRSTSFIKRRLADSYGTMRAFFICLKQNPDIIIFVGGGLFNIILYKLVCLLSGSLYYREKSEIPFMEKDNISSREVKEIKRQSSLFDGHIVITNNLGEFFTKELNLKIKTITIPILIEIVNNLKTPAFSKRRDYILYTGSLLERKDGVVTLLKAFSEVSKIHSELKLYITGDAKQSTDYGLISNTISQLKLNDKVVFTGFVSLEELQQLINEAKLCILLKPENRQNKYNFPTKIGEYMVTGCPVVSSKNETLADFFKDKKNVFFTNFDAQYIAQTISFVISNPELSEKVGLAAKEMVIEKFNAGNQMKKLKDFFNNELN